MGREASQVPRIQGGQPCNIIAWIQDMLFLYLQEMVREKLFLNYYLTEGYHMYRE